MATIKLGGKTVTIDDVFLEMTPEEQDAVIEDIAADMSSMDAGPSAQQRYDAALKKVREVGFKGYSDEEFEKFASERLGPYNLQEIAQHGQLFGLTDEIAAGTSAATDQVAKWLGGGGEDFGPSYEAWKELQEARRDLGRESAGGLGVAAEVVGGLTSFGTGGGGNAAAPLWQKMGTGAGQGAAVGAAYGAGAADEDRLGEAAKGALVGGALGAAVPAVAAGVSSGYRNVANALTANAGARRMGLQPQSARVLQETMAADDALSPAGLARMRAAGDEAMPVDAGASARNMLDYTIQSSGGAGRIAQEAIGGRVNRDAAAIQRALDDALGAPQGVETTRAQIRLDSAGARGAAYDEAYAAPIDYSSEAGRRLEELISRVDQADINAANRLMRAEGLQSNQIMAQVADDGTVTFMRMPDVRQIDYITRALNDRSAANAGLGKMGGQTNEGRVFGNLSADMRGAAREAVPEYGAALETAADPIRRSQAVEFGAEVLSSGTTREAVAMRVQNMTGPELEAVAQGIRSNLDDVLANVTRAVTDGDMPAREAIKALRELSTRAARTKVATVIGDEQAATLFDEIDRATQSFELRAGVADNSRTFQRQEMARRVDEIADPDGIVATAAKGEPVNALKRGVQALTGMTKRNSLVRKDAINSEVANFLTAQGPEAFSRMNALQALNTQTGNVLRRTISLRDMISRTNPTAPYLSAQLTLNREQ